MQSEHTFVRNETLPSWWPDAVGKFLSVFAAGFHVTKLDDTHVQVLAGADDQAAVIAIEGLMRWNETTVTRAHPGGAAGAYDVFVTTAADNIVSTPSPFTDATDRSFALAILAAGSTPTIVAGTVDAFRRVSQAQWDGSKITALTPVVPSPIAPVTYRTGTSTARLAAVDIDGLLWRETDTGTLYIGTGTTWVQITPGPWLALTLQPTMSSFGYQPAARTRAGGGVELRGGMENVSGATVLAGVLLATVPLHPSQAVWAGSAALEGSGASAQPAVVSINPSGQLSCNINLAAAQILSLDSCNYTV